MVRLVLALAGVPGGISGLWLGCVGSGEAGACPSGSSRQADGICHPDQSTDGSDGGPADGEDASPVTPELSTADALALLEVALAAGIPEPYSLITTYKDRLAHAEPSCPGVRSAEEEGATGGGWTADCTTSAGWTFSGNSQFLMTGESDERFELEHAASYAISGPGGEAMTGGGVVQFVRERLGEELDFEVILGGVFTAEPTDTWLGSSAAVGLVYSGGRVDGQRWLELSGGVDRGDVQLDFVDLRLDPASCGAPEGVLGLRDPSGYWFSVNLDCSSCGPLVFDGQDLDWVCIDGLENALEGLVDSVEAG